MDDIDHKDECEGNLIPDAERGGRKCSLCDYWISDPPPRWREEPAEKIPDELPF